MSIIVKGTAAYLRLTHPKDAAQAGNPPRFNFNVGLAFNEQEEAKLLNAISAVYDETLGKAVAASAFRAAHGKQQLTLDAEAKFPKRPELAGRGLRAFASLNSRGFSTAEQAMTGALVYVTPQGPRRAVFSQPAPGKLVLMSDADIERIQPGAELSVQLDFWLNSKQANKPIFTLVGVIFHNQNEVFSGSSGFDTGGCEVEVADAAIVM